MTKHNENITAILNELTVEEKIALLAGANVWESVALPQYKLRAVSFNDGPFGLRKPKDPEQAAIGEATIKATSFPTTSLLSSTFNTDLLNKMGLALGEECNDQAVDVLLGPGLNIKRSPLCGRNFEYFSEDPLVTSRLAAALVAGIEATGVGACVKHFAANNQENKRFTSNSIIDARALHEIYLKVFKDVLKTNPRALMCSYNYLNGVKVSENHDLLTNILRHEFKYQGLIVSDWGAVKNITASVKAGLNLEMPGGYLDRAKLINALKTNELTLQEVNEALTPLLSLSSRLSAGRSQTKCDYDAHFALAVKIAEEGAVLLKNDDNLLPLTNKQSIALIGNFHKNPHFQGLGSSAVSPTKITSLYEEFRNAGVVFEYADGYQENEITPNETLSNEAVKLAATVERVILGVGLPEPYEVEGTDRVLLDLPPSHSALIKRVAAVNPNIIIVLNAGAPVSMPWLKEVKSVLHMHLPGSAGAKATYNLLFGEANPSGKLAETYPLSIKDTPTADTFWQSKRNVIYRESIYVGYRYYDKANQAVLFPFGYGLSYTKFALSNYELIYEARTKKFKVKFRIRNIGDYPGAEVIGLYVGKATSVTFNPKKELRDFIKVFLKKDEERELTLAVDEEELAFYDPLQEKWVLEQTTYKFFLGLNVNEAIVVGSHFLTSGETLAHYDNFRALLPHYFDLDKDIKFSSLVKEFKILYGGKLPLVSEERKRPFTNEAALTDTTNYRVGRYLSENAIQIFNKVNPNNISPFLKENITLLPLRSFVELTNRAFTYDDVEALRQILNGKKKNT